MPANEAVDRVRTTPWWNAGEHAVPALVPDVLAAALTSHVLKFRSDMAPKWLAGAIENKIGEDFVGRVARIVHDIDFMEDTPSQIPDWLVQVITADPQRAGTFRSLVVNVHLPYRLERLAATAGESLANCTTNELELAEILLGQNAHLARVGRKSEALAVAQRAVALYEKLGGPDDKLAASLNNLANRLIEVVILKGHLPQCNVA